MFSGVLLYIMVNKQRGMIIVSKCVCCREEEYINHVFVSSQVVKDVWTWFSNIFEVYSDADDNFLEKVETK